MMAFFSAFALAAAAQQTPGLRAVDGLTGCWKAPGQVRGKVATSVARGSWRLGGRYLMLQLRSTTPKRPYEAAIVYGAGEKPNEIGSFWMDTFGGLYSPSLGAGEIAADGFQQTYRFPDALYVNSFRRRGHGWRWTITEQATGKPEKLFAQYELTPTSCRSIKFSF